MVSFDEARSLIIGRAEPLGVDSIAPRVGDVLAEPFVAQLDNPRFDCSAMDGYGFALADLGKSVPIVSTVYAGGRIKHMTPAMNEAIRRSFGRLDVTHARQKSRVLVAREPQPGPPAQPSVENHADLGISPVPAPGVIGMAMRDQRPRLGLRGIHPCAGRGQIDAFRFRFDPTA